jgi:hypothetical protein
MVLNQMFLPTSKIARRKTSTAAQQYSTGQELAEIEFFYSLVRHHPLGVRRSSFPTRRLTKV